MYRHWFGALISIAIATASASAAEIDPKLIADAKKEGQLIYYTDLIIEQVVRPLVGAFEKKYGIRVSFTRGDSQVNTVKVLNEFKAGRVQSDVFGLTSGFHVLVDVGAVRQFYHRQQRRAAAALPRSQPLLGRHPCLRDDARPQHLPGAGGAAAQDLRRPAAALLARQDGVEAERHVGATGFVGNVLTSWASSAGWTTCASSPARRSGWSMPARGRSSTR